jgi:probable addiction module antidote protein
MPKLKTKVFDPLKYMKDAESQKIILEDAIESGDPSHIAYVLGLIAKAQGMTKVAKKDGVTREGLYKSLTRDGDPRLSTFTGTMKALGYKLKVESA